MEFRRDQDGMRFKLPEGRWNAAAGDSPSGNISLVPNHMLPGASFDQEAAMAQGLDNQTMAEAFYASQYSG